MAEKTSIIGKSLKGQPVVAFENEAAVKHWLKTRPNRPALKWFKQTITETEIDLDAN